MSAKRSNAAVDDPSEVSPDELREFLAGDVSGERARPEFREELRRKLWDLLQDRSRRADPADGGD